MRLISSADDLAATFDLLLEQCNKISFAVAWASCGFRASDALLRSRDKIRAGIIGTHFYQTDPAFIQSFSGAKSVKFVLNPSGVFHPKIYLFTGRGKAWDCLIGSANFTSGAFNLNSEAVVHITGDDDIDGKFLSEITNNIMSYWHRDDAKYADEMDLERYGYWREHFRRPFEKSQGRFGQKLATKNLEEIAILNMSWSEFFLNVQQDPYHALARRILVLDRAQKLFRKHGSLAAMPIRDRQGVAGIIDTEDTPWGWFGSMRGAGVFKNLINENSPELSNALDQIPLDGPVQHDDYEEFVTQYKTAFPTQNGQPYRHGLGTATRLLAMKRPDYFVCFDSANAAGLSGAFGVSVGRHDYIAYWDSIIERICEARWWNSRQPKGADEREVWRGRAAFLDAIYYNQSRIGQ